MKVLTSYSFAAEAFPLLAFLEFYGIPAVLSDTHVALANPLVSKDMGNVRVMVADVYYHRALALLEEFNEQPAADPAPADPRWATEFDPVQTWCPSCEAFPVYRKRFSLGKTFLAVVATVLCYPLVFLFRSRRLDCARCGHSWTR